VILIVKSLNVLFPSAALLALAATLTGCGQTGPLYMPTPPAKPANATLGATPLATPAPAPTSAPSPAPVQTTAPAPGAGTAQPSPTSVPPQQ